MLIAVFRGFSLSALVLFTLVNLLFGSFSNAHAQGSSEVLYPGLRSVLLVMAEVDQEVRAELLNKGFGNLDSQDMAHQNAVDEANIKILSKLIDDYGWPTEEMVGLDGVSAAFLIVQHAGHAFQKKMLPMIKASFERGDLNGSDYALLQDRVLVGDGLPQRYGSQASLENGFIVLFPIEDERNVDRIRASLGLEPLADYIRSLESLYGMKYRPN